MPSNPEAKAMPSAERYARYREDQTTVWISKRAATFLARESDGEGTAAVLDRLLAELKTLRKSSPAEAAPRATKRRA
jgi:hypothetical protein